MDPVNLATAVHRLARLAKGTHEKKLVVAHPRSVELLDALAVQLSNLKGQGLVNTLWAVTELQHQPEWLPALLQLCTERHAEFSARDLSATLSCLGKADCVKAPEVEGLKTAVVEALRLRVSELETPTDLACAAAALSKLGIRDEQVFARLAEQTLGMADMADPSDIASILWAFAHINFTHKGLFEGIRRRLESQVQECTPRELVQIAWALSRVKQADEELLMQVFAPVVRAKMLEFDAPRDLCTLAWTFSHAGVLDEALFNDLAHVLSAKVKHMNAHDVSSVVVAFANIEYAHKRFFRSLQKHTRSIVNSFSPLQLARTIYGFGVAGVDDEPLFRILTDRVMKQLHLLHAKNVVEIVIGLSEAEYAPAKVMSGLLKDTDKLTKWLGAEDAIQLLHAVSRLPEDVYEAAQLDRAVAALAELVRRRVQGWWRFRPQDLADLLEATQALKLSDALILESACRQLQRLFQSPACDDALFLRLWGGLAELPHQGRSQVKEHLHRRAQLRSAVEERLAAAAGTLGDDPRSQALLLYACARLGYDGEVVEGVCCAVREALESPRQLADARDWLPLLCWSLAELGWEQDLARRCLTHVVQTRSAEDSGSSAAHLRLAWAAAMLDQDLRPFVAGLHRHFGDASSAAQDSTGLLPQVSLQWALQKRAGREVSAAHADPAEVPDRWLEGLLDARIGKTSRGHRGRAMPERPQDQWISKALLQLRTPHESPFLVAGAHSVTAALPAQKKVIAVLGHEDLAVPSHRLLGSALLRQRHLEELGWQCKHLLMRDVKLAEKAGALHEFLQEQL